MHGVGNFTYPHRIGISQTLPHPIHGIGLRFEDIRTSLDYLDLKLSTKSFPLRKKFVNISKQVPKTQFETFPAKRYFT